MGEQQVPVYSLRPSGSGQPGPPERNGIPDLEAATHLANKPVTRKSSAGNRTNTDSEMSEPKIELLL